MGGSMIAKETPIESAIRCFKRETGLTLSGKELVLGAVNTWLWKNRNQEPKDIGCHMAGFVFVVELPETAINTIVLEKKEFETEKGLTPFRRDDLIREGVFPAILDFYDHIFPPDPIKTDAKAIRHVVLIKFNKETSESDKKKVYDLYQEIAGACGGKEAGIKEFIVRESLDKRKTDLVVVALFDSRAALENFRIHKKHSELTDLLRMVANWWVGNFEID